MSQKPPADAAEHAADFARRWADRLDEYCALRMEELAIPAEMIRAPDRDQQAGWRAFDWTQRSGGTITSGIVLDSVIFNASLLQGKGKRKWARARLRDRVDAIIAHEFEESRHGTHSSALRAAAKTSLAIRPGARLILRAMAR